MSLAEARAVYINATTSALQRYVVAGDRAARATKMMEYTPAQASEADTAIYQRLLSDEQKVGPGRMPERSGLTMATSATTGWGKKDRATSGVSMQPETQVHHSAGHNPNDDQTLYEEGMAALVEHSNSTLTAHHRAESLNSVNPAGVPRVPTGDANTNTPGYKISRNPLFLATPESAQKPSSSRKGKSPYNKKNKAMNKKIKNQKANEESGFKWVHQSPTSGDYPQGTTPKRR